MKIVVTGAFRNIGSHTVASLLDAGHRVRGVSVDPKGDLKVAQTFAGRIEVVRGDVRSAEDMDAAVEGQDVVVHLAYVIPPLCLEQPEASRSVNVDGTRNVIEAVRHAGEQTGKAPRLLFASSLDVYGHTSHLEPPRRTDDPVQATDIYTQHKIECENLVRDSGLVWSMFRFADVPPIAIRDPHPIMFTIPLEQRFEVIHPRDAGLAVARAVNCKQAWGRVLNIGGGPRCQITYGEYLSAFLDAMGIGALPREWFSTKPYCTDWLDSDESQGLLQYQRYDFHDIVRETAALMGWRAPLARALRPFVRWHIGRLARVAATRV